MRALWPAAGAAAAAALLSLAPAGAETYSYAITEKGGASGTVAVEITTEGGQIVCESLQSTPRGSERTVVRTDLRGRLIDASRTVSTAAGAVKTETARRTGAAVTVGSRAVDVPSDAEPAVDSSLLLLLRAFPFGTPTVWKLLMVDFSQISVAATVRHVATESVRVPAGEIECHRMEVVVGLPLIRPRVTLWITAAAPHFLVRHQGKKGPFTPYYETSLISVGSDPPR